MHKFLSSWFKRYLSDPEAIGILVLLASAIFALKTMGNILAPLIAGIVIAYMLSGLVKKLVEWHFPHALAVAVVFIIFLGIFLFAFIWLLPLLWEQLNHLFVEMPRALSKGQVLFGVLYKRYPDFFSSDNWQQITSQLTSYVANFGKDFLSLSLKYIMSTATLVIYLVLVPLLVFFFLRDSKIILRWAQKFLPTKKTAIYGIWDEVHQQIGSYIKGKMLEIAIVSLTAIIAFAILRLNYAVLLGFLVGLSAVIPYIGVVIVTLPIVIVGVVQWGFTNHFLYLMIVYVVMIVVDANILVPFLFAEAMNLHPIAIIFAVLLFGGLGGFWGIFFAIPLMTFFNVLIKKWPQNGSG
jgi:putative permease